MDENTKAFIEVGKKLHKDNEATLAELKKINKPSTLQQSTQENAGEILSGLLVGALDRKAEAQVAKGTNLGVGVSAKNGIDIVPGGEPVVDEKDTLFGITKAFYDKYNFGNLLVLTKQNLKTNDKVLEGFQSLNKSTEKNNDEQRNIFQKLLDFFKKSDSSSGVALKEKKSKAVKEESLLKRLANFLDPSEEKKGFGAGLRGGTGITKLRTTLSDKLNGMLKSFKGFPMMIGEAIAFPIRLITKGLFKLGGILLKPLGSIVKGIASLPGKILGFFGGVIGMIGRLALLGGGIFALAKLTEYLRGVGPGGQQSFTDMLMFAFEKVKAVFILLKDIIMETVIPALGALATALFTMVGHLAKLGLLPGVKMGKGRAAQAEETIRKRIEDNPNFSHLSEEEKEKIIQENIRIQKEARMEEYRGIKYRAAGIHISSLEKKRDLLNKQGNLKKALEVQAEIEELVAEQEGSLLTIGGKEIKIVSFSKLVTEFDKKMEKIKPKTESTVIGSGNLTSKVDARSVNYTTSDQLYYAKNPHLFSPY